MSYNITLQRLKNAVKDIKSEWYEGNDSHSTAEYRGNLNAIAVYKTALTDTELANLTSYSNHDLFIPYRSRMQMIGADQELQCTEHDITRFLWNQDY